MKPLDTARILRVAIGTITDNERDELFGQIFREILADGPVVNFRKIPRGITLGDANFLLTSLIQMQKIHIMRMLSEDFYGAGMEEIEAMINEKIKIMTRLETIIFSAGASVDEMYRLRDLREAYKKNLSNTFGLYQYSVGLYSIFMRISLEE